uniref:Uncharacterized protein n=1 Tax=Arundo donax TaxID=35708 RepID=A0A0A9GVB8_ARUDO
MFSMTTLSQALRSSITSMQGSVAGGRRAGGGWNRRRGRVEEQTGPRFAPSTGNGQAASVVKPHESSR